MLKSSEIYFRHTFHCTNTHCDVAKHLKMYISGSSDAGSQKSRRPKTGADPLISHLFLFNISSTLGPYRALLQIGYQLRRSNSGQFNATPNHLPIPHNHTACPSADKTASDPALSSQCRRSSCKFSDSEVQPSYPPQFCFWCSEF